MGYQHLQSSFAGGEIAPELEGRVDIAKYAISLKSAKNFIPLPQGPITNRPGTYFIGMSKYTNKKSRLIPFIYSDTDAYVLEFGDKYIRFFKNGGQILEDTYNATIPAWNSSTNYAIGDYVLATGQDSPGVYSIHLFKSIKYFNLGFAPINSPTYWQDLGFLPAWNSGTTYASGAYVSKVRVSDGKTKTFKSLVNSNLNNDPLNPTPPWTNIAPNYDNAHTYALNDYVVVRVGNDDYRYKSLQNSNTGHQPESSPTYWDLDQPALWQAGTTYSLNAYTQYNGSWVGNIATWSNASTYNLNDQVTVIRSSDKKQLLFKSLISSNFNNDPLNPQTWWNVTTIPFWGVGYTYAQNDYVIMGVFSGPYMNWYRYKSLQNSNTGHDPTTSPTWWVLDQPATWSNATTYAVGALVQRYDGHRYIIYQSGLSSNLNHDPLNSGPAWSDITPNGGYFRIYQSGINSNLGHNPTDPYSGPSWQEVIHPMPYEITTPYGESDLDVLKYAQSADTLYLDHPNYPPKVLQRFSDNNWTFTDYVFNNGPFMLSNTNALRSMSLGLVSGSTYSLDTAGTPAYDYFDQKHVGALFQLKTTTPKTVLPATGKVANYTSPNLKCGGKWSLETYGIWSGTVQVQMSIDDGGSWNTIYGAISTADKNLNISGNEDNGGDPFFLRVVYTWVSHAGDTGLSFNLYADAFEQTAVYKVSSVTDARHTLGTLVSGVLFPTPRFITDWAEGSWSEYRGWPRTVTFFQDRLVHASTKSEPQTVWATKTSNYNDYGRSNPLVDSDGISVNLTNRQINPIKSIFSFLSSCLAFTGSSEWTVAGDQGAAITPSTVFTKLQGLRGVGNNDPIMIGNRIVFIEPKGTTVRDMAYQYFTDTFDSENISVFAPHLFKGYDIVGAAYQKEPFSLLWLVRSDGKLLCLTYMREQEVLAWSIHETAGSFESICSIPGNGVDEVWFVVNRGNRRYIERMLKRTISTDPADQYFVDCGITYEGVGTTSLSGFDHLNELTVAINAGGNVLDNQVVHNGIVNLGASYSKVHVGLPYYSDIETLNPNIPAQGGEFTGRKYQINRVIFRFLNSKGGWFGSEEISLTDQIEERASLYTGFDAYTLPQGDDSRSHVLFRQKDPMPVTIVSIASIMSPGENP